MSIQRILYKIKHKDDMCPNCLCIHNGEHVLCFSCIGEYSKPVMITESELDEHKLRNAFKPSDRKPLWGAPA